MVSKKLSDLSLPHLQEELMHTIFMGCTSPEGGTEIDLGNERYEYRPIYNPARTSPEMPRLYADFCKVQQIFAAYEETIRKYTLDNKSFTPFKAFETFKNIEPAAAAMKKA